MSKFSLFVLCLFLFSYCFSTHIVVVDRNGLLKAVLNDHDSILDYPISEDDEVEEHSIVPQTETNGISETNPSVFCDRCVEMSLRKNLKRKRTFDNYEDDGDRATKIARYSMDYTSDSVLVRTAISSPIRQRLPEGWSCVSTDGLKGDPNARIVVFGLWKGTCVESLTQFFKQYGAIDDAVHFTDYENNQPTLSIFQFREAEAARHAVESKAEYYSLDFSEKFGVDYCPHDFCPSSRYIRFIIPRQRAQAEAVQGSLKIDFLEAKFGKIVDITWLNERKGTIIFNFEYEAKIASEYLKSIGIEMRTLGKSEAIVQIDNVHRDSNFITLHPSTSETFSVMQLPREWKSISVDSLGGDPYSRIVVFMMGRKLEWVSVRRHFAKFGKIVKAFGFDDRVNGKNNLVVIQYLQRESANLAVYASYYSVFRKHYDFGVDFCRHNFYYGNRQIKFELPDAVRNCPIIASRLKREWLSYKFGKILSYRFKPGTSQGYVTFNFHQHAIAARNYLRRMLPSSNPDDKLILNVLDLEEEYRK